MGPSYNALTRKNPIFPRVFRPLGVFAPLVRALVFKTSGGFEQSSQWVRFPYTPDFLSALMHRRESAAFPLPSIRVCRRYGQEFGSLDRRQSITNADFKGRPHYRLQAILRVVHG